MFRFKFPFYIYILFSSLQVFYYLTMSISNNSDLINSWIDRIVVKPNNHPIYIHANVFFSMYCDHMTSPTFTNVGYFIRALKKAMKTKPRIPNIKISESIKIKDNKRRHYIIIYNYSDKNCHLLSDKTSHASSDICSPQQSDMITMMVIIDVADLRLKTLIYFKVQHKPTSSPSLLLSPSTLSPSNLTPSQPPPSLALPLPLTIHTTIPSDMPTKTPSNYPLLQSLGIHASFDNDDEVNKIESLLAELVVLHKTNKKQMHFSHLGNGKPGLLVQIPRAKNFLTYEKNKRKEHWLEACIQFIATNTTSSSNSLDNVTAWLLKVIHKNNRNTFLNVATQMGLHVVQKMNSIEAAAMWTEANVSLRSARIILSHLNLKFKNRVQVPLHQLSLLSAITDRLQPVFGSFIYNKNEGVSNKEQMKEKIQYWTYPIIDLLLYDYQRLLQSEMPIFREYGYNSKVFEGKMGVMIIIGSDHGCSKSRFLIRTNYLDSKSRRKMNKADYGTRTLQFAEVDCKKDVCDVHSKIAPDINIAIKKLGESKLVALKVGKKIAKCMLLPIEAKEIHTLLDKNDIYIIYLLNQEVVKIDSEVNLSLGSLSESIEIKTIIQKFQVVIAGDLSYFATCTGRDGHSHCWCPYCDATQSDWSNHFVTPHKMSLSSLYHYASIYSKKTSKQNDTKGVIMRPLLDVEPHYYIVPILHLLIGIVNKEWITMLNFFDEFVENVSDEEADLKDKKLIIETKLQELGEELEILTVNKDVSCMEMAVSKDATEIYNASVKRIKAINIQKKKDNHELRKLKLNLNNEQQKRGYKDDGLEDSLYGILEDCKIQKQHFHGGSMNGVCCRRLLDNLDIIFPKIKRITSDRLKSNAQRKYDRDITILTEVIEKFEYLFETTDLVFSNLRILAPSEEEVCDTEKAIKVLEQIWKDLELHVTPKAHILFDHTVEQIRFFEGISDLVEDFIERSHQMGKKLDHLVARMSSQGFRKQELTKIRRRWLSNDPFVLKQLSKVHDLNKRKKLDSPIPTSNAITKARETKRVKRERVKTTFEMHHY